MKYEVTMTVKVDPNADFAGTEDELELVFEMLDMAVFDLDDLIVEDLEVLQRG